ncbi:response regulator transcription factor, partial [Pseudomonas paracarnis]
ATIKAHVTAIFRKLGVRTRTQAALLLQQLESISQHYVTAASRFFDFA